MTLAVEADLARMEDLDKGVRGSLAALARKLAGAMDATGEDQATPAQIGSLGQQLRVTLHSLMGDSGDQTAAEAFFRLMSDAIRPDDERVAKIKLRPAVPISGEE